MGKAKGTSGLSTAALEAAGGGMLAAVSGGSRGEEEEQEVAVDSDETPGRKACVCVCG